MIRSILLRRTVPRPRFLSVALTIALSLSVFGIGFITPTAVAETTTPTVELGAPSNLKTGEAGTVTVVVTGASDAYAVGAELEKSGVSLNAATEMTSGPEGGFTAARDSSDVIYLDSSRLGTSPGIDGTVALSVPVGGETVGTAHITLSTVTIVDSQGALTTITADETKDVQITKSSDETSDKTGELAQTGANLLPILLGFSVALVTAIAAALLRVITRQHHRSEESR